MADVILAAQARAFSADVSDGSDTRVCALHACVLTLTSKAEVFDTEASSFFSQPFRVVRLDAHLI